MPELPEVETTVRGLQKEVVGFTILDVWTDLKTKDKRKSDTVANPTYFKLFKKEVLGKKIISAERRAKNILINLSGGKTILVHMKMTGYLFVGKYNSPSSLSFPKYTHFVFFLSPTSPRLHRARGKKYLAFSDLRKFGKITLLGSKEAHETKHLKNLGPEPLALNFTLEKFKERLLKKPNGKIKTVLMNQEIIVGIGNIYSDEILWLAGIRPDRLVSKIKPMEYKYMYQAMKKLLAKGIAFGGDSMSDYRNIYGLPGEFQMHHKAYKRKGEKCMKKGCRGVIIRKIINNRSAHYCSLHQK